MASESVYLVDPTSAAALERTTLGAEGLLERRHLQEWILENPAMLGDDLLIVTDEFDRWQDFKGNALADRLDVLALDPDGRPVVVELKRGAAPRLTELQAVQYAAMVSRFEPDDLVEAHRAFLARRGTAVDRAEARAKIDAFTREGLSEQRMRSPRIMLVAEEFGPAVTASVVWLSEQGVDLSLRQLQLYRSGAGLLLTASQLFPVRDVEEFTVRPRRREAEAVREQPAYPHVAWTRDDLAALIAELEGRVQMPTVLAMLDLAASAPDLRVPWRHVVEETPRSATEAASDLAHLTRIVRQQFDRDNWPVAVITRGDDLWYELEPRLAESWRELRGAALHSAQKTA